MIKCNICQFRAVNCMIIMVLTIILLTILKSFNSTIIMGPRWYDYHGFTIIAQPYLLTPIWYVYRNDQWPWWLTLGLSMWGMACIYIWVKVSIKKMFQCTGWSMYVCIPTGVYSVDNILSQGQVQQLVQC